jgi:pro-sigmaK processing inhibitor BofA
VRTVKKLLLNAVFGVIILFFYNMVGYNLGMSVGINPVNIGVVTVLGVPGFATLLVLQVIGKA